MVEKMNPVTFDLALTLQVSGFSFQTLTQKQPCEQIFHFIPD